MFLRKIYLNLKASLEESPLPKGHSNPLRALPFSPDFQQPWGKVTLSVLDLWAKIRRIYDRRHWSCQMRTLTIVLAYILQILLLIWLTVTVISFVENIAGRTIGIGAGILVALGVWFLVIDPIMEWTRRRF